MQPTTKPTTTRLSVPELLALADEALKIEKPGKSVDRYWLVALALQESGGDPYSIGDGGRARGLFQFHDAAWLDCWGLELAIRDRTTPLVSFRAAIRYAGKVKPLSSRLLPKTERARLSSHHHLGHVNLDDTPYIASVERKYQKLVQEFGHAKTE